MLPKKLPISWCPAVELPKKLAWCPAVELPEKLAWCPAVGMPKTLAWCPAVVMPKKLTWCPAVELPKKLAWCPAAQKLACRFPELPKCPFNEYYTLPSYCTISIIPYMVAKPILML